MKRPLGKIAAAFMVLLFDVALPSLCQLQIANTFVPRSRGRGRARIAVLCLCLLYAVGTPPARPQGTGGSSTSPFATFDAPGAGTGMLQGTLPVSINGTGDITGTFIVGVNVAHGFVRAANGTITAFDAPDAGTGKNQGTFPVSINAAADIAGMYFDASNAYHGFVRAAGGTITEFDVPGAPTAVGHRGTQPTSIDTAGDITGLYTDTNAVRHGFVRAANGTITTFDVPGAGTGSIQGTVPLSINTTGNITGFYVDPGRVAHGFLRAANGTITAPIDAPSAATGGCTLQILFKNVVGTGAIRIDDSGDITGIYIDTSCVRHAFVRAANGAITTFDAPGAATSTGMLQGTFPGGINTGGDIAGLYQDASGVFHGFLRAADGTITAPIDVPGAATAGLLPGTGVSSINDSGVITGLYSDANVVFHGFVLPTSTTTPVGSGVSVSLLDATTHTTSATVTFSNVAQAGATTFTISSGGPPPPPGFKLGNPPTYFRLTTTAVFSGPVTVCINYSNISFDNVSALKLFHFENNTWVDATTSLDTISHIICAVVTSLSPFAIFEPAPPVANVVKTVAGGFVGDGAPATEAALDFPQFIARDEFGNLFISDFLHHRVRKVSSTGMITTVVGDGIAGFSGDGGPASAARVSFPTGIVVDPFGNLIIADQGNNRIRKVSRAGVITTIAGNGTPGFSGDGGPATQASLNAPFGLAMDAGGNLYFSDLANQRVRRITPAGVINTVAGNGVPGFNGDGIPAASASLNLPRGLAVDLGGNLYIADSANDRVRLVTPLGTILTAAGTGGPGFSGDGGPALNARVGRPRGVTLDAVGNLYISNAGRDRVRKVDANTHIITTFAGSFCCFNGDGLKALDTKFAFTPTGLLFDGAGNLLIVDSSNGRVRKVDAATQVVSTIAGGFVGDGNPATSADLQSPLGLAFGAGGLLIADQLHNRVRKVDSSGIISTIAGIGTDGPRVPGPPFSGDGGPATAAELFGPFQAIVNRAGETFISDEFNGAIRKIDRSGIIATLAEVGDPTALVLDAAENLIVADAGNCVVVKVSPAGVVTTVAGNGVCDFAGDGGLAIAASLNTPEGVVFDTLGNLYISDTGNNRIRKVDRSGAITTIAGDVICGFAGDGGPASAAELCFPLGLAFDSSGNLYIADNGNLRVRKIDRALTITTVAGTGNKGFNGDNLPPLQTNLDGPEALLVDSLGNVLIADDSFLVREIVTLTPTITTISPTSAIAGGAPFTLTVNGTNFVSGSTVNFGANAVATTFVSAAQLTAATPASDIAAAGTFNVTVTNAGGGTSNAVSFTVVTPQDATQAITNSVNVLFSQGVINGGQDNSLVVQLQHAITMMSAGKNAGAIGNLDSFISEVNDLLSSGILSPSQAASLVSAAKSVIAAL